VAQKKRGVTNEHSIGASGLMVHTGLGLDQIHFENDATYQRMLIHVPVAIGWFGAHNRQSDAVLFPSNGTLKPN
jgi:hypothetical protein